MAEILHIEILRKHGQTHTQTDRQTDRHGHYNTSPSPYGGRGNHKSSIQEVIPYYLPNSYQKLTKSKIRSSWSRFKHCSESLL